MTDALRPSWDDYFMTVARIVATRATCDRLHTGAVLVKDNRIVSTGYNGSPPHFPHCDDSGHLLEEGHCVRTVHGEHNALLQAAVIGGTSTQGTTLYSVYSPCIHCSKYIATAGVSRVVVGKVYRNTQAIDYLKEGGITVDLYEMNPQWNSHISELLVKDIPVKEGRKVTLTE